MKAMILAAGRGERMRPLTDHCPKPLLKVAGKPLIQWHIERLVQSGITQIIINTAWLGELIEQTLGNGQAFGASIQYSHETHPGLETAGGIAHALPLLGERFLVVNGDIWSDWDFKQAITIAKTLQAHQAHLVMVDNPAHNPQGDFLLEQGHIKILNGQQTGLTFSGIGMYHATLFKALAEQTPTPRYKLRPIFEHAITEHQLFGEYHAGTWFDIGTPERLAQLEQLINSTL